LGGRLGQTGRLAEVACARGVRRRLGVQRLVLGSRLDRRLVDRGWLVLVNGRLLGLLNWSWLGLGLIGGCRLGRWLGRRGSLRRPFNGRGHEGLLGLTPHLGLAGRRRQCPGLGLGPGRGRLSRRPCLCLAPP